MKAWFATLICLAVTLGAGNALGQPHWRDDGINGPPEEIVIVENDTFSFVMEVLDGGEFERWDFRVNGSAGLNLMVERIDSHKSRITLNPWIGSRGDYEIRVIAQTPDGLGLVADIVVTVLFLNRPPELVQLLPDVRKFEDQNLFVIELFRLTDYFSDPDDDTLLFELIDAPPLLHFIINDETSVLSMRMVRNFFTPEPLEVIVKASDTDSTATYDTFTVYIRPINDPLLPFHLIDPPDSSNAPDDSTVTFVWHQSVNVDPDLVSYVISFSRNNNLIFVHSTGIDTTYTVRSDVIDTGIRWWVLAHTLNDSVRSIETFTLFPPLDVEDKHPLPQNFSLSAFPNPFNSTTTISFSVGALREAPLRLAIYDINGRMVADLVTGKNAYPPGQHKITWDAGSVGAGVYFVHLEYNGVKLSRKLLLIK